MKQAEAGKGSAPRKGADYDAYRIGWERIFGKKDDKKAEKKK